MDFAGLRGNGFLFCFLRNRIGPVLPVFQGRKIYGTQHELAADGNGNGIDMVMQGCLVIEWQVEINWENQAFLPDQDRAFAAPEPEQARWKADAKFFDFDMQ